MPLRSTSRRLLVVLSILAIAILPAAAIDEPLRALRSAKIGLQAGPRPEIDLEAPPTAYPLKPVEQLPFRGARHGLVTTTTGTIASQTLDTRLPRHMPIEMTRVFDCAISPFLLPQRQLCRTSRGGLMIRDPGAVTLRLASRQMGSNPARALRSGIVTLPTAQARRHTIARSDKQSETTWRDETSQALTRTHA